MHQIWRSRLSFGESSDEFIVENRYRWRQDLRGRVEIPGLKMFRFHEFDTRKLFRSKRKYESENEECKRFGG